MKKIINGKRYDTDTAMEVAYTSYGNRRDFRFWKETLYRKNTGEFFLHGVGGPTSKYAVSTGMNQWSGGEMIIPLTIEAAQEWAEKYLDVDEYEKIFGVIEETAEKRTVTFSLPESIIEKIARIASAQGLSKSDVIAQAIERL